MTYFFSVVRFVPDPGRGEGINLGVVAGDDEIGDWELRVVSNLSRAKSFDTTGRLPAALAFIGQLESQVDAWEQLVPESGEPITVSFLDRASVEMRNIVQFTPPAPVIASTATEAIDLLFTEFVLDPASRTFRFEKKHRAVKSTQLSYRAHNVPDESVARKASVRSGPFEQVFDFAVHNGHVVQLVQCWSFQLPNQAALAEEVKAWAWVASELRRYGGEMDTDQAGFSIPSGENLEIACVFVSPEGSQPSSAFEEARAAFDETQTLAVEAEKADIVGERAALLLGVDR
jgi:hypothetical protein